MSTTVRKFKLFMPHQDLEQEAWLSSMAAAGLHLEAIGAFGMWTFRHGAPAQVAYRTDFYSIQQSADCRRLFEDAGWQLVGTVGACQYWRKAAADGRMPEIYTDQQSKIAKFQRMLMFLGFMLLPMMLTSLPMVVKQLTGPRDLDFMPTSVIVVVCVVMVLYAYTILGLLVRIQALRGNARAV